MDKMNMINGHPVKYIVNGDMVIAMIKGCCNDVTSYADDQYKIWFPIYNRKHHDVDLPDVMKGYAKCDPRDTFDEELGKRIAYRRLQKKYWEKFSDRLTKVSWILQEEHGNILKDIGKFAFRAMSIEPMEGIVNHAD